MPARKNTDTGNVANGVSVQNAEPQQGKDNTAARQSGVGVDGMSVEDLTLPRSMIQRLAKGVLAPNTQITKDAILALSKSATVFVSYLASNANDRAVLAGKKTIQPADVTNALAELEFENFIPRCEGELTKYNNIQCDKRNSYRRRVREEKAATEGEGANGTDGDADATNPISPQARSTKGINGSGRRGDSPPTKRVRTSGITAASNGDENGYESGDTIDVEGSEAEAATDDDDEGDEEADSAAEEIEDDVEDTGELEDSRIRPDEDEDEDEDENSDSD